MRILAPGALAGAALCLAQPAAAQADSPPQGPDLLEESIFAGDYLSLGIGAAVSPSYTGSDDYTVFPLPIVQGSYGGIDINPRAGGVGLDFVPDGEDEIGLDLGVAARLRGDRASRIGDEVVKSLGELDRAIEVGPSAGISASQVLNRYDSLSFSTDVLWDINGAHEGMVVSPSVSYFTPVSRAVAGSLTLGAEYADADFNDYYFTVTPAQGTASGLPAFDAHESGFTSVSATLLTAFDLDGDLTNGGWGLVGIAGYSRVVGQAADTPLTTIRGSRDQFLGAMGVGYTF
jgi:outer membrane scaffolding protein for murein synthesis (MipA/OmpV family)